MMVRFPATRDQALEALQEFLPHCGRYASRRNHVEPGHRNVSRLSPAIRTRVLLEQEVCEAALRRHAPSTVEKFVQEVYWRLYWKGWLEMRPAVWAQYREALSSFSDEEKERAHKLEQGESGVALMDHFARELVETGYLHNHARMWYASFWVHVERLPWELGADFFLRHLLDGDAASNTLSWRWVAGLHTRGKTYLVRRSNIERYCHSDLLAENAEGMERLEDPAPVLSLPGVFENPPPQPFPNGAFHAAQLPERWGLWIHEDDLSPERSEIASTPPVSMRLFLQRDAWARLGYPERKRDHLKRALEDGARRAETHFGTACDCHDAGDLGAALVQWAEEKNLGAIVSFAPFVGSLGDQMPQVESQLRDAGVSLVLVRREHDAKVMRHARGGFFGFWKKIAPRALC